MLKAAERTSGLSREDLTELIADDPEIVPLVTRVLHYAAMTGQDKIIETMGMVFGVALRDRPRSEDYELMLSGLGGLRSSDIALIRYLEDADVVSQEDGNAEVDVERDHYTARGIASDACYPTEEVRFSLVRLTNHGFATSTAVLGGTRFAITSLGRLLHDVLQVVHQPTD